MSVIYARAAARGLTLGHHSCSCCDSSSFCQAEIILAGGCLEGYRVHTADRADGVSVLLDDELQNIPDVPCPLNRANVILCFCRWHLRCHTGQLTQPGRQSQHAKQRAMFPSSPPLPFLGDLSVSLCFLQGLRGSAEGWEGEGNLVSDAHHLLRLFICPLSSRKGCHFLSARPLYSRTKLKG